MPEYIVSQRVKKIALWLIFLIYILIILRLTIFRLTPLDQRQLNLTLFTDLINIYRYTGLMPFIRVFLGNIAWFIPFGFLLPMLIKRNSFWLITLSGFLFSLTIEATQYIFYRGVAELDDLILNTIGVIIGYFAFKLFSLHLEAHEKKHGKTDIIISISYKYLAAFLILFAAIATIAIFVQGGFIRNHFGDILIVIFIYCFIKSFVKNKLKWLWLYIFIFATLVEIGQYFGLVYLLGLGHSQLARIVIGVTFDIWDIVMYFVGCVLILVYEKIRGEKIRYEKK